MTAEEGKTTDGVPRVRASERVAIQAQVMLRRAAQNNYKVNAYDISRYGCKVEFVERPRIHECVWVKFHGLEAIEAEVCWTADFAAGLKFQHPLHPAVFDSLVSRLR